MVEFCFAAGLTSGEANGVPRVWPRVGVRKARPGKRRGELEAGRSVCNWPHGDGYVVGCV